MLIGGDDTQCFPRKTSRNSWLRKRKTCFNFEEIFPPITLKHTRTWAKKDKSHSPYRTIVSTPHGLMQLTNFLTSHLLNFQSTVKLHDFLSNQNWVVSQIWSRFRDSDCKWSRPRNDNKFPRNSLGSLELVVVSKTTVLEQPSNADSIHSPTSKEHMKWGTKYFQAQVHKKVWTQEGIRSLLIWTMLKSTGKMISCM